MSTQIAVRLPEEIVSFLDEVVGCGEAPSRAAIISRALERERRERAAAKDARILASVGPEDDLDDLVAWSVQNTNIGG